MKEQKSFNDLINELNKVVKEYGYSNIKDIKIKSNTCEFLEYHFIAD